MGRFGSHDTTEEDNFAISGPKRLTNQTSNGIDWDNEEQHRCVLACLVRGAYAMERDRTKARKPLAPEWWKTFHFRLLQTLRCECRQLCRPCQAGDERRRSIYGAIFEYVPPEGERHQSAPGYVVAFRGTIVGLHDLFLDSNIVINQQHKRDHFSKAREQVEEFMKNIVVAENKDGRAAGDSAIWLAGHSLGASIALDVGRHMMTERRRNLPTFLFNPPQVSPSPAIDMLEPVLTEVAKRDLFALSYWVKHVLGTTAFRSQARYMEELFEKLAPWVPDLYVNQRDIVCGGFVDYFEQRELMKERHAGVATSAATLSYRDMCYVLVGKHNDRSHLLPSARVWKNQGSRARGIGKSHELSQWWQPQGPDGLELISNRYSWP